MERTGGMDLGGYGNKDGHDCEGFGRWEAGDRKSRKKERERKSCIYVMC
jgi:hypothetical protein